MENDIVFADEVDEFGVAGPVFLPVGGFEPAGDADVTDRRFEPHVQHFSVFTGHRHLHAPVEVAGHGAGAQAFVQPAAALPEHIGFPVVAAVDVLVQEFVLQAVERQVPVLGRAQHRRVAAEGRARFFQFLRAQRAAAFFALVAIRIRVGTNRAGADDIAVGQELTGFFVVELFAYFFRKGTFLEQVAEHLRSGFVVQRIGSAAVMVERNAEAVESIADEGVVAVYQFLRTDAFLAGADGDGHAMLVAATDEDYVIAAQPAPAHIEIGRQISSGQVSEMHRSIGVWKGCGNRNLALRHGRQR